MNEITISASTDKVATIDIEGVIGAPDNAATYEKFKQALARIARTEASEVVVNIRSTGGNVNDALLIYEALAELPAAVTTRCWGYVASAATIIAQAAAPGRREMSANALYLIHRSVSAAHGNRDEIIQTAELLGKTDQRIASIYAGRSGKDVQLFVEMMNQNNGNGRWMSAEEALEAALIDKVINAEPISNSAARAIEKMGLPPIPKTLTNKKTMTIVEKWNAIRQIIMQGEPENQTTPQHDDLLAQIETLQNQISELEAAGTKSKVRPTATKEREDIPLEAPRLTPNQEAYMADALKFRH